MTNYSALIDYFGKCPKTQNKSEAADFAKVNKKSVLFGYIVHPDCCNNTVMQWLDTLTRDYNKTFYKKWNDVLSKNRFELYVDQIMHYATTYGTDFNLGNGFVPNDGSETPPFKDLKVIEPIEIDELFEKCLEILNSGIAIKESTITNICAFVIDRIREKNLPKSETIDILTNVKSKEAQCVLAFNLGILPNDGFGILRCLVYAITGSSMLIKSRDALKKISGNTQKYSEHWKLFSSLTDGQMEKLSGIFLRYKPIFLAMKKGGKDYGVVAKVVNKLRRLADKNHTPLKVGFWENIVTTKHPIGEVREKASELNNFKKIRLIMTLREKLLKEKDDDIGLFVIRNGKMFVRKDYSPNYDLNWIRGVYNVLVESLTASLSKKACRVKFPKNLRVALPTSEKNFVGNVPFGSSLELTTNNIIGIYWRNEWGARDIDLSSADIKGNIFSWCNQYYDGSNSIVYSGDMTNADPEAVELFYIRGNCPDLIINTNVYRPTYDSANPKFRFFFANEQPSPTTTLCNHMVDPNNVKFETMLQSESSNPQKTIGVILDNRFVFTDFSSGRHAVAKTGKYISDIIKVLKFKMRGFIDLEKILLKAGFTVDEENPEIDFTDLNKDTLISLLSD